MSAADVVGALGVAILLLAFALNAFGRLSSAASVYHGLNAIGAALTLWASWQIGFVPFVVLEAAWLAAALVALFRRPAGAGVSV